MRRLVRTGVIALFFLCAACQSAESRCKKAQQAAQEPFSCDSTCSEVVVGLTQFGVDLFQEMAVRAGENFCVSPYSISSALSMPYVGAHLDTAYQMAQVLHYPKGVQEVASVFSELQGQMAGATSYQLYSANSLWFQKGMVLERDFLKVMTDKYCGLIQKADFEKSANQAIERINKWVADQTDNEITDLIHPLDVSRSTRMALVSALYLRAAWASPFSPSESATAPFHLQDGGETQVEMMHQVGSYPYYKGDKFAALELPYLSQGDEEPLAMWILLPDEPGGIPYLRQVLTAKLLSDVAEGLTSHSIDLQLPKFSIEFRVQMDELLKGLGMALPFSFTADFSGIDGTRDLRLERVVHQAMIEVDEAGTVAAAATAVTMGLKSMPPSSPLLFHADHPFIYLIRSKSTGVIYFMGRLAVPARPPSAS